MARQITRRDILNGMVIGTGVGALAPYALFALDPKSKSDLGLEQASTYPPTLTGMRGSHEGSFEVAHALAWEGKKPDRYAAQEEHYDLVVVGAGMSGLAAAWFYRKKMGHQARVLILDNTMTSVAMPSVTSFTTKAEWC